MSFDIGGLFKALVNPASLLQLAMGPAGWASLAVQTIASAIGKEIIQALGEKLGLPQPIIDLAKSAFSAASGTVGGPETIKDAVTQLAEQFGLSPMQQGELQRAAEQDVADAIDNLAVSGAEAQESKEAKASKGQGWLMAIATSLGNSANKMAKDLKTMGDALGKDAKAKDNIEFSAKSQEFAQFFSGANTVIKTLGEALSAGARKQ